MAQSLHSFPDPPEFTGSRKPHDPEAPAKAEVAHWPDTDWTATVEFDALLDEVAMQALLMTKQATSVAIALLEGSEMVCRANAGGHAPDLGDQLDMESGLSGACVQSKQVQICSDTEKDPRVNVEACRALGVRSILVAPLLQDETLIGVMELFSPEVRSFGEEDIQTLEICSHRILERMTKNKGEDKPSSNDGKAAPPKFDPRADEPPDQAELFQDAGPVRVTESSRKIEPIPVSEPARSPEPLPATQNSEADAWPALELMILSGRLGAIEKPKTVETRNEVRGKNAFVGAPAPVLSSTPARSVEPPPSLMANLPEPPHRRDWITPLLTGLVIGLAILFGTLLGMRSARQHSNRPAARVASGNITPKVPTPPAQTAAAASVATAASVPAASAATHNRTGVLTAARKVESGNENAGGLVVYQNDRVVFALPPNGEKAQADAADPTAPARLSSEAAGQLLASRVEPQYPPEAIAAKIQGTVGVRLLVDRTGTVERARVFSGPQELAQAAVEAVKQWTFRPYAPNGSPKEFETTATIDFKLP